jgi:hypothetical protein
MKPSAEELLGGHAFGTLTEDESRQLYTAALDDQELFDALVDQEPLRELLADRTARRDLLQALDAPSLGQRVRALLRRPATWADLGVAAATLVVALMVLRPLPPTPIESPRAASASPVLLRALFDLPVQGASPADARVEGDRLSFRVDHAAQVIVVAKTSDGALVQLFPPPGVAGWVPAGWTPAVDRPRGAGSRVRFAAFPPTVDPQALDPARLRDVAAEIRVLEWEPSAMGDRQP